jgi:hypothetical protein
MFRKVEITMIAKVIVYFVLVFSFIVGCLIYRKVEVKKEEKIQIDESFSQLLRKNHQLHMKYREHMPKVSKKKPFIINRLFKSL